MTMAMTTQLTRTVAVAIMVIINVGVAPCLGVLNRRTLGVLYTFISKREQTRSASGGASASRGTFQEWL